MERIARYTDRLTWLERGRIVTDGPVREGLWTAAVGPPLVQLAKALDWRPLPLTIKEGKRFANTISLELRPVAQPPPVNVGVPVLEVEGANFAYNGVATLKNIDLIVRAGETVALVGRNGAGKSTLLKCITGLLPLRSGDIRVAGQSTRGRTVADICRQVAYLPQNPDDLLFAETVVDELQITLRNHKRDESSRAVAELLARLEIGELALLYPRDLSVGQRQRVALGAVTITQPSVLLLDEPTRGLDPTLKASLVNLWKKWLADGAAILLVTHDVELAAMIADRTVMLSQGEVIASGPTREVLGSSPHFSPQIARLFPGRGWLSVADVLRNVNQ